MSTLLYATNGRVQELPEGTKFLFWDKQDDLGRAWKIAKIEMHHVLGRKQAPLYEVYVDLFIKNIFQDPCKTFVSRPDWQQTDWEQWGKMCRWAFDFIPNNPLAFDSILNDIRSGNCGRWLGQFLLAVSNGLKAYGDVCYVSQDAVDNTVFWDFHEFVKWNPNRPNESCKSKRISPDVGNFTQEQIMDFFAMFNWMRAREGLGDVTLEEFLTVWLPKIGVKTIEDYMAKNEPKQAMKMEVASAPMHDPALVDESGEMVPQGTKKTNWTVYGIIAAALLGAYVLVRK